MAWRPIRFNYTNKSNAKYNIRGSEMSTNIYVCQLSVSLGSVIIYVYDYLTAGSWKKRARRDPCKTSGCTQCLTHAS